MKPLTRSRYRTFDEGYINKSRFNNVQQEFNHAHDNIKHKPTPLNVLDIPQDLISAVLGSPLQNDKQAIGVSKILNETKIDNELHYSLIEDIAHKITMNFISKHSSETNTLQIQEKFANNGNKFLIAHLVNGNDCLLLSVYKITPDFSYYNYFDVLFNRCVKYNITVNFIVSPLDLSSFCYYREVIFIKDFRSFARGNEKELAVLKTMYEDVENLLDLWKLVMRVAASTQISVGIRNEFISFVFSKCDKTNLLIAMIVLNVHYPITKDVEFLSGSSFNIKKLSYTSVCHTLENIAYKTGISIDTCSLEVLQLMREVLIDEFWSNDLCIDKIKESLLRVDPTEVLWKIFFRLSCINLKLIDITEMGSALSRSMSDEDIANILIIREYLGSIESVESRSCVINH